MKKILTIVLALGMAFSLVACDSSANTNSATDSNIKIAIVKQLDHASMDEIAVAVEKGIKDSTGEVAIEVEHFSGQNDPSTLQQIAAELLSDKVDVIVPIGTLAAQQMVTAVEGSDVKVVFSAVSAPEENGLVDIDYLTGVSDALNTDFIMDMMLKLDPEVKTVGLLYSTSENNSIPFIESAKVYLDAKGISYIEKTGNTNDEIIAAVNSILDQVDAVFTPTDNVVMAAELAIAETLAENGIPHYTGADSFVRNGAFTTAGVNYTDLGIKCGEMAVEIANGGEIGDFITMPGGIITVNTETATTLGVDYSVFSEMGEVVEVTTTVD